MGFAAEEFFPLRGSNSLFLERNFKNINPKPVAEHQYQFPVFFLFFFFHILPRVLRLTQVNSNGFSFCTFDAPNMQGGVTAAAQTETRRKSLDNRQPTHK